jgi:hypothetical protein
MPRTSGTPNALSNGARGWWVIQLWSRCRPVLPSQHAQHLGTRTSLRSSCSRSLTTATRVVTSAKLTGLATNMALPCAGLDAVNALQISASSTAPGGVPNQWSVATPQAARGWARPRCRPFKDQSCCCLGCAFEAAAFQTLRASRVPQRRGLGTCWCWACSRVSSRWWVRATTLSSRWMVPRSRRSTRRWAASSRSWWPRRSSRAR